MHFLVEDSNANNLIEEAVTFNTESHINFFHSIFEIYDADFNSWVTSQAVDRAAVNIHIGVLIMKLTVPCCNHLLNSEVCDMTIRNSQLTYVLEEVQQTMQDCKKSIKNSAILRNILDIRPIFIIILAGQANMMYCNNSRIFAITYYKLMMILILIFE